MIRKRVHPVIFFAMLLVVSLQGCATLKATFSGPKPTPRTRLALMETDYTAALKFLVDARKAGRISDEQYNQIEAVRAPAAAAIDELKKADGNGSLSEAMLDQAQFVIDRLMVWQATVKGNK